MDEPKRRCPLRKPFEDIDAACDRVTFLQVGEHKFGLCSLGHVALGGVAYSYPLLWVPILAYQFIDYGLNKDDLGINLAEHLAGWMLAKKIKSSR